jgi:hypothetical protein
MDRFLVFIFAAVPEGFPHQEEVGQEGQPKQVSIWARAAAQEARTFMRESPA